MKKAYWLVAGIIGAILLLFLFGGGMMGGWGMMGNFGYGGYGMMNNWGSSSFGWFGMIFMLLIAVGLISLAVIGVVWLVRKAGNSTPPSS